MIKNGVAMRIISMSCKLNKTGKAIMLWKRGRNYINQLQRAETPETLIIQTFRFRLRLRWVGNQRRYFISVKQLTKVGLKEGHGFESWNIISALNYPVC